MKYYNLEAHQIIGKKVPHPYSYGVSYFINDINDLEMWYGIYSSRFGIDGTLIEWKPGSLEVNNEIVKANAENVGNEIINDLKRFK